MHHIISLKLVLVNNILKSHILLFVFLIIGFGNNLYGQKQPDKIINSFINYTELPREVVSIHLNKTVFIGGEEIAFQAYVFEKGSYLRSKETTNLYCTLTDSTNTVIKKKLIKVEDGFANGSFKLDNNLKKGVYRFKAFTNWMRNFSEKNHYEQQVVVLNTSNPAVSSKKETFSIDAQFLPEGGHALVGVENVFGVIIKDQNGFGIEGMEGKIVDATNVEVSTFTTDQFGISRFLISPVLGRSYYATFELNNDLYRLPLKYIKKSGINMQLTDMESKVGIIFNRVGNVPDTYSLIIHNGKNLKAIDLDFSENQKKIKVFNKEDLNPGINIFTLFDPSGTPILERLFFNFQDIATVELGDIIKTTKLADSIKVTIPVTNINASKNHRFSISVLPAKTKANKNNHSVASYLHLSPYLKGTIQNAKYYFNLTNRKKKFQFDNLLLTQGWSSYNWFDITTKQPKYLFDFEKGISIKGIRNRGEFETVLLSPIENNGLETLSFDKSTNSFEKDFLFPYEDENLRFSFIKDNGNFKGAPIYVTFKPRRIPEFKTRFRTKSNLNKPFYNIINTQDFFGLRQIIELKEVTVKADKRAQRIEDLKKKSFGQIHAFSINDPRKSLPFSNFLRSNGFIVIEDGLDLIIGSRRLGVFLSPDIYLNDRQLFHFSELATFSLNAVDYIEIDKTKINPGLYGQSSFGTIKIYTDQRLAAVPENFRSFFNEVEIPLAFSRPKRFYNPKYIDYNNLSYQEIGAIDWHANLKVDSSNNIVFKIPDFNQDEIKVFIEGIINDNQLVSKTFYSKL